MIELLIFILLLTVFIWFKKQSKLPPGPYGLPIVGYCPFVLSDPMVKIQKLSNVYDPIMRINLLGEDLYVLNSFEAAKEAFKNQGETFLGRPSSGFSIANELLGNKGITNIEGEEWKIQHRFFTAKLSQLGMGKSHFAEKVHELCDDLIDNILIERQEEITDLFSYFSNFSSNVITTLLDGTKYHPNDPVYGHLSRTLHNVTSCWPGLYIFLSGNISNLLIKSQRGLWNKFLEYRQDLFQLMSSRVKDRMENSDENATDDLLGYYKKEMSGPNAHIFDEQSLIMNYFLLLIDGTHTSASTMNFGFGLLAIHQNVQRKMYAEILEHFGKEYHILPKDMEKLNYTRAVIDEINRFACVVPLTLIHCNRKSATVCGFHIPKDSKILANTLKLARDKQYFKNPDEFDPSNFLDEQNNYVPNPALIPFGIGKRICLGKKLAEMEMEVVFTRLVQYFEWLPPKNEEIKLEVIEAVVRHLKPFKIIAKRRTDQ